MPMNGMRDSAESRVTSQFAPISVLRIVQIPEAVQVGAGTAGESLRSRSSRPRADGEGG